MVLNEDLFREEAVANKWRGEKFDDLLRITAPHEWAIVAVLVLVFLGIITWILFGSVERTVRADCLLIRPGERQAIVAAASGTVVEVLAKPRDSVEAGQAIARLYLPEPHQHARLAQACVDLLEMQLASRGGDEVRDRLRSAREELQALEVLARTAGIIVSPHAGELTTIDLIPGQGVTAGAKIADVRTGSDHRLQAVSFVKPASARNMGAGLAARLRILSTGTGNDVWVPDAVIADISDGPTAVPDWFNSPKLLQSVRGHLLRLDFRAPQAVKLAEGQHCDIQVVTGRQSPLSLVF